MKVTFQTKLEREMVANTLERLLNELKERSLATAKARNISVALLCVECAPVEES